MRILILGGNGFIGSAVTAELIGRRHLVKAVARDPSVAARRQPDADWVQADIARLVTANDWRPFLAGMDAVVNCAGALQDGARDDVAAVQDRAMRALYEAAAEAGLALIVQISARTDGAAADTPFLATKRRADDALEKSGVPFVILRPAMVVGRNAHGGSALLRALAAFPGVTPLVHAQAPVQFAALDDVARAVAEAIEGGIPPGSDLDIAASGVMSLAEAVAVHRQWLGLGPARTIALPASFGRIVARAADLLGWMGWRSPLRSTAMIAAEGGILALPANALPFAPKTLEDILRAEPAGVQDLWFARLYLFKAPIIGVLSLFWLLSGAIALACFDLSASYLAAAGIPPGLVPVLTAGTAVADILLGVGVLFRRFAALSLKGMICLSLAYLAGATFLQPSLWLDPVGPLVKVLPSMALAGIVLAILDER